jgi:hypothetical protein
MVVDDLDIMSVPVVPHKAHAPLIIDPDRVLPTPIPSKPRWLAGGEARSSGVCAIQHQQFAPRHLPKPATSGRRHRL